MKNNQSMDNPLVSVLIPCYNAEKYVEESILSILNQNYTRLEIIAIDDCSTDSTNAILNKLASQDNRITVVVNEVNLKLIKTLNKGVSLCSGEYIARIDSDDIALPTRIEKQVKFLNNNLDHDIVSTMFYTFKSNSSKRNLYINPSKHEELQSFLLFKSGICHPAVMMRKRLFTELNLKFESQYLHVEDYALWSKALYLTKLANIEEPLLLYRVHESQISTINEQRQIDNKKEVFKIHCEALGLKQDDHSLDVYASVAESVPFQKSMEFITECEDFMLLLRSKNQEKPFCNDVYLENLLSMHWIRLCANSQLGFKVLKKCMSSKLYNSANYQLRDHLVLFVKCLFRLEYKKSFIYKLVFR